MSRTASGLVVFVCPHGVGKSRMAAALFEAGCHDLGLTDWSATTAAGDEPGDALSAHAIRLLAGGPAETFLQPGPGRELHELAAVPNPGHVLVVGIDLDSTAEPVDRNWRLHAQEPDARMRAEIGAHVSQLLEELAG